MGFSVAIKGNVKRNVAAALRILGNVAATEFLKKRAEPC